MMENNKIHNCLRCGKEIYKQSNFCSEVCRRNYRYHNVIGVKERDKEYFKEYRIKNREKINEYRIKNRLKVRSPRTKLSKKESRIRQKEIIKQTFPAKLNAWKNDYKRKDSKCYNCGSFNSLEFHHTDYIKHIGVTLCTPCHRKIHNELKGEIIK